MVKLMEMLERYRQCVMENPENARVMCPPQWEMLRDGENEVQVADGSVVIEGKSVIETPIVCPAGQKPDKNGRCRQIFYSREYQNL